MAKHRKNKSTHTSQALNAMGLLMLSLIFCVCSADDAEINVSAVALFKDKAMLAINGKRRMLKVGATTAEGVKLLSASSDGALVELNGKQVNLKLDGKIVSNYVRGIEAQSLKLYPDRQGHYVVDGLLNGNGLRFLVDTGATAVSINKGAAKRMGLLYRVDGLPTRVTTAAGVVPAYRVIFDEVKIRNLSVKRVEGIVVDGDYPREALLGQSFLNRLNMQRIGQVLELRER